MNRGRSSGPLRLADCTVDLTNARVEREGEEVTLTRLEARLLGYLVERRDRPVSRDELLREVWGYRAGVPTRTVENTIRRLRKKIEPDPSRPQHILSRYGVGYRFDPLEDEASGEPVARATNLAEDWTLFVGRSDESDQIDALLQRMPLATIAGLPGIGKTRLARHYAAGLIDAYAGGVWFCDLTAARTEAEVVRSVAAALGLDMAVAEALPTDAGAQVGRAIRQKGSTLLVLDGLEDPDLGPPVAEWILQAPHARFVVTATAPLGMPGERVIELGPLGEDDGIALLLDRACAIRPDFAAHPGEAELVPELVRRLGGLPLALELLAGRANVLTAGQLHERLGQPLDLLRQTGRTSTLRHASVREAFDRVWHPLPAWCQDALSQLANGADTFDLGDAERALSLGPDAPPAIDVVQDLRDRCLLRAAPSPGSALRFRLHPLLMDYARERARPALANAWPRLA